MHHTGIFSLNTSNGTVINISQLSVQRAKSGAIVHSIIGIIIIIMRDSHLHVEQWTSENRKPTKVKNHMHSK